jgi:hypothetical protein
VLEKERVRERKRKKKTGRQKECTALVKAVGMGIACNTLCPTKQAVKNKRNQ